MDLAAITDGADRFVVYVEELTSVIGHADRAGPLRDYCAALLTAEGRKSVEPMAAVTAPAHVSVQHQKLLHFVGEGKWSDERVLAKVRELVMPAIERHGPIKAWIIDDTSYPKQGTHSVGVHHQYCGQLGKQANCQVAVTLSIANHHASLPIAYRLYLPKDWAEDAERRNKAHVPEAIRFKTKPQIALAQLGAALAAGVAPGVVLMDASYGTNSALRAGIAALALTYVAAILPTVKVRAVADPDARVSAKELALGLPKHAWRTITWRDGSAGPLCSRFARVRVRTAPFRGAAARREGTAASLRSRFARVRVRIAPMRGAAGRAEETLLIEWPQGEAAPTKYWLSNLDPNVSFRRLVDVAKMRWRIERDYQDLKQEIGLGHYEGRGWLGFHHHGTLAIAAYGFLISERETIPPSGPRPAKMLTQPAIPAGYRPRGAADSASAPRPQLNRHHPSSLDRRDCPNAAALSILCAQPPTKSTTPLMIQ
jgi:SRSO17 transposase